MSSLHTKEWAFLLRQGHPWEESRERERTLESNHMISAAKSAATLDPCSPVEVLRFNAARKRFRGFCFVLFLAMNYILICREEVFGGKSGRRQLRTYQYNRGKKH